MNLEASDGRVVLIPWKEKSKIIKGPEIVVPDNVDLGDFPTMEIVHVGQGTKSPYNGERQEAPWQAGDRVVVNYQKCARGQLDGVWYYFADWTAVLAKVTD